MFDEYDKRFQEQFKTAQNGDHQLKSYSRETSSTTHITRNADGSVHKETVTTERLPDGSTKTTRIVNSTPAFNDSRESMTETTVTTRPSTTPADSLEDTSRNRPPIEEKPKIEGNKLEPDKKGNGDPKNWAWWFWSRK